MASDYSGMDFERLLNLDFLSFRVLVRDAFIYQMKQTKEGRDYLEECWLLKQTRPDKEKLREKFSK